MLTSPVGRPRLSVTTNPDHAMSTTLNSVFRSGVPLSRRAAHGAIESGVLSAASPDAAAQVITGRATGYSTFGRLPIMSLGAVACRSRT